VPADRTPFSIRETAIAGLLQITMRQASDARGTVREFYRGSAFEGSGIARPWAQINLTETNQGAIRGLHGEDMAKLVAVVAGEAFGAWVDLRPGSPTRGGLVTFALRPGTQVLVPNGICNGFQSVSPGTTQYIYCFDAEWVPGVQRYAINPLDGELAIPWPISVADRLVELLSERDIGAPSFREAMG
jgi:dTDP-4-dehydrorhamnose 3,5-epimerase